ncbi:MAG TPA: hypothetical protein VE991_13725, partial [Acidimicrobiales bacterium]|nr:hypothetical protein [Acidimicrobiales bacterium]
FRLRLWLEHELIAAVEDSGFPPPSPFLGFHPPDIHASNGRGLWLARQTFDHVEISASPLGGALVHLAATLDR